MLIVHTHIETTEDEIIGFISARKADKSEGNLYEKTTLVKTKSKPIPADQLAKLRAMQDEAIDYSDAPKTRMQETTDGIVGRSDQHLKLSLATITL